MAYGALELPYQATNRKKKFTTLEKMMTATTPIIHIILMLHGYAIKRKDIYPLLNLTSNLLKNNGRPMAL